VGGAVVVGATTGAVQPMIAGVHATSVANKMNNFLIFSLPLLIYIGDFSRIVVPTQDTVIMKFYRHILVW
jgi:fucose permease